MAPDETDWLRAHVFTSRLLLRAFIFPKSFLFGCHPFKAVAVAAVVVVVVAGSLAPCSFHRMCVHRHQFRPGVVSTDGFFNEAVFWLLLFFFPWFDVVARELLLMLGAVGKVCWFLRSCWGPGVCRPLMVG